MVRLLFIWEIVSYRQGYALKATEKKVHFPPEFLLAIRKAQFPQVTFNT
jgi:hypothetical protein